MKIIVFMANADICREMMLSFIKAIKKKSIDVLVIDVHQHLIDIKNILDFSPDFALICEFYPLYGGQFEKHFKNENDRFFLRKAKIPIVCLYYDNPFFYIDDGIRRELIDYSDYYIHFMLDEDWLEFFKKEGFKNGYKLLGAVDHDLFHPKSNIKLNSHLVFVGGWRLNVDPLKFPPLINEFIHRAIDLKIQWMGIPTLVICLNLFKDPKFKPIHDLWTNDPRFFWRVIYCAMNIYGSYYLRDYVLKNIKNIAINLYSKQPIRNENIRSLGTVCYGELLSTIYQEHMIVLNISVLELETSLNNRFFDVFASKGFLLSDYKRDLTKVFKGYWQQITYRNMEELNNKIEYYLTHPKERQEIIDQAYNDILKNHTYDHRINEILEIFQVNFKHSASGN